MISLWIGYGTNFTRGTDQSQSKAAWEIPVCLQLLPAIKLACGMLPFLPEFPRHLINRGKEHDALETIARLRNTSTDDMRVRVEFLEMKALYEFEKTTKAENYPRCQSDSFFDSVKLAWYDWTSLVRYKSLFKRTTTACFITTFQPWNGINAINYFAPFIFQGFDMNPHTTGLLATGVVGVLEFGFTILAVLYVDKFGRKSILIAGAFAVAACHCIVAGLFGAFNTAGWVGIVFVWIYVANLPGIRDLLPGLLSRRVSRCPSARRASL